MLTVEVVGLLSLCLVCCVAFSCFFLKTLFDNVSKKKSYTTLHHSDHTVKMTSAHEVETSVAINSPSQDSSVSP